MGQPSQQTSSSIAEQIQAIEYRSQRSFLMLSVGLGLVGGGFLTTLSMRGAILWLVQHLVLVGILGALLAFRKGSRLLGLIIPLLTVLSLATIPVYLPSGYNLWAPLFGGVGVSIITRDYRAPLPSMAIVLAAVGYYAWAGRDLGPGLGIDLLFLIVIGLIAFVVTLRMHQTQKVLQGAALQESTVRRLDSAMRTLAAGGRQISNSSQVLGDGAGQAATQVREVLVPAVHHLEEAASGMQRVEQASAEAMQTLSRAVSQVVGAMGDQAQQVTEAARVAAEMAEGAREVATGVAEVATTATASAAEAASGQQVASQVLAGIGTVESSLGLISEQMEALLERSGQITEVVRTISNIAQQTNMLALNAAIEAARAGASGRGFAVVAEEVRKLSEHSAHSAQEITAMVAAVQADVRTVAEAVARGAGDARQVGARTGDVGASLDRIVAAAERTAAEVRRIGGRGDALVAGARQVSEYLAGLAAVAEETNAATEEMGAVARQVEGDSREAADYVAAVGRAAQNVAQASSQMDAVVGVTAQGARDLQRLAAELLKSVEQSE